MDRFEAAARHYIQHHRPRLGSLLKHFAQQASLYDAIAYAALGLDERGKRHPHQRRLSKDALVRAQDALLARRELLGSCTDFAALHNMVERVAGQIDGIGELYCYDIALRIGAYLRIFPEEVYLHRGAKDGAKALGYDTDRDALRMGELSDSVQELEPYEIEDLLCIYKNQFKTTGK
jgi:hypothetical protein